MEINELIGKRVDIFPTIGEVFEIAAIDERSDAILLRSIDGESHGYLSRPSGEYKGLFGFYLTLSLSRLNDGIWIIVE